MVWDIGLDGSGQIARHAFDYTKRQPSLLGVNAVLLNDPYRGGLHCPEHTFFKPFYVDGELLHVFLADEAGLTAVTRAVELSGEGAHDLETARLTAREARETVTGP
jgi:hypothetical protein